MTKIQPFKDETALAFIERADSVDLSDDKINAVLQKYFGINNAGEIKKLKLKSAIFWAKFFRRHASGIHERGGSRYAAITFVSKKNGQAGQKTLTEVQIEELVDSVGTWLR